MFETIRAHGALRIRADQNLEEAASRHTPKIAFVAKPVAYTASSGKPVSSAGHRSAGARAVDGQAYHAMMGTAAVAIGTAAAIPARWSIWRRVVATPTRCVSPSVRHFACGAEAQQVNGDWTVTKAIMSRSARVLMEGWVRVPEIGLAGRTPAACWT